MGEEGMGVFGGDVIGGVCAGEGWRVEGNTRLTGRGEHQ